MCKFFFVLTTIYIDCLGIRSNKRRDGYGGSIENRAKFTLRVVDEVAARVGPQRTGLRISPWNDYQDMRMKDPVPTFSYLASELKKRQPGLAYLHAVEDHLKIKSNDFLRKIWQPNGGVFLSAGGHNRESAFKFAEEKGDVVVFGKMFISNVSFHNIGNAYVLKINAAGSPSSYRERHSVHKIRLYHVLYMDE